MLRRALMGALFGCGLVYCGSAAAAVKSGDYQNNRPTCFNQMLIETVKAKINTYNQQNPDNSIYEQRRRDLLMRNLDNFVPVSSVDFTAEQDFRTANRLVTLKVNQGYTDADFTICKNLTQGEERPIYLLIYTPRGASRPQVEIINFLPPEKSGEVFSIN